VIWLHEKELLFNFWAMLHREGEMKGSLGYSDEFNDVMDFFKNKKINAQHFVSDIIKLEDL
jgi:threonine dehydrogenase-like Zn-dependent dehydrogenase